MSTKLYLVRQYRPNYFSGFEDEVYKDVPEDKITSVPFADNFKRKGFERFEVEPYGDELIISAHYGDGTHWVVGFALPMESEAMSNNGDLMRENWRYANAKALPAA